MTVNYPMYSRELKELQKKHNLKFSDIVMMSLNLACAMEGPKRWQECPKTLVSVHLPENVASMIEMMALITNSNHAEIESAVVDDLILRGVRSILYRIREKKEVYDDLFQFTKKWGEVVSDAEAEEMKETVRKEFKDEG